MSGLGAAAGLPVPCGELPTLVVTVPPYAHEILVSPTGTVILSLCPCSHLGHPSAGGCDSGRLPGGREHLSPSQAPGDAAGGPPGTPVAPTRPSLMQEWLLRGRATQLPGSTFRGHGGDPCHTAFPVVAKCCVMLQGVRPVLGGPGGADVTRSLGAFGSDANEEA